MIDAVREKSRRYPDERVEAIVAELEQVVRERGRPAANHLGYAVPAPAPLPSPASSLC